MSEQETCMPEMQNTYARPHRANVLLLIYLQVLFSPSACPKPWWLQGGSCTWVALPLPACFLLLTAPGAVPGGKSAQGADWAEN